MGNKQHSRGYSRVTLMGEVAMGAVYRSACIFLLAAVLTACPSVPRQPGPGESFGKFEQPVQTEWLPDGRNMKLLRESVFHDTMQSLTWTAPESARIDGASIPKIFWTLLSGPYEGRYRDASVNHDYETCVKLRPWRQVHRMFYYAMRAQGETKARAALMYFAVWHFGPRWPAQGFTAATDPNMQAPREAMTEADARRAQELFEREPDISLEEIENIDAGKIRARLSAAGVAAMDMKGMREGLQIPIATKDAPCVVVE